MIKLIEEKIRKSNAHGGGAIPGKVIGLTGFDKITDEIVLKLREKFPAKGEAKILNLLLLSGSFSERELASVLHAVYPEKSAERCHKRIDMHRNGVKASHAPSKAYDALEWIEDQKKGN